MTTDEFEALCRKEYVNPATATPCWFHPNSPAKTGYCQAQFDGRRAYVHVFAYELFVGPVEKGFEVDHTCNPKDGTKTNRACCNPQHLEQVTSRVNSLRSEPAMRTHCKKEGHEMTPDNTIIRDRIQNGYRKITRECRRCVNDRFKAINAKRRKDPGFVERNRQLVQDYRDRIREAVGGPLTPEAMEKWKEIREAETAKQHADRVATFEKLEAEKKAAQSQQPEQ